MSEPLADRVERLTGQRPVATTALHGGCIAQAQKVELADGTRLVAKRSAGGNLELEAWMLGELRRRSDLPVPEVVALEADLLLMTYIDHDAGAAPGPVAQRHAAELIAALHAVHGKHFGLERDTLIGPLPQPNGETATWLELFRDRRLLHMAEEAHRHGALPAGTRARLEQLAARLDRYLEEPPAPSLLHGDLWTGNVLVCGDRIAGFVDPAIYYGHPEIELAFSTLFGTFAAPFFERYAALAPFDRGFFELRRDLYNLYPLLVHVRLFGTSYLGGVERTLRRLDL